MSEDVVFIGMWDTSTGSHWFGGDTNWVGQSRSPRILARASRVEDVYGVDYGSHFRRLSPRLSFSQAITPASLSELWS